MHVFRSVKTDDDLDPVETINELLEEIKIDDPPRLTNFLRKQIMLRVAHINLLPRSSLQLICWPFS